MWFAGWIEIVLFNLKNKPSLDPNPFPYLCSRYQQNFKVFKTFSVATAPFPLPPFPPLPIPLGTAQVKITVTELCVVKPRVVCARRDFSAPLKQLTTPSCWKHSAVGFYDTTFFWICSYLFGFFGFSSAWHLNVGGPQGSVWAFCVLHLHSSRSGAVGLLPLTISCFMSLCSALSSELQIGTVNALLEIFTLVSSRHLKLKNILRFFHPQTDCSFRLLHCNKTVPLSSRCSRHTQMTSLCHLLGLCFSLRKTKQNNLTSKEFWCDNIVLSSRGKRKIFTLPPHLFSWNEYTISCNSVAPLKFFPFHLYI